MSYKSRVAVLEDKAKVLDVIKKTCESMPDNVITIENYTQVAEHVLSDIDWGFFILAEDE